MKPATVLELRPNDSRKSFYGKAQIVYSENAQILFSYSTPVAYFDNNGDFHRCWGGWSATTGRHIKAFSGRNKADWDKMPVEPVPAY